MKLSGRQIKHFWFSYKSTIDLNVTVGLHRMTEFDEGPVSRALLT
jgi:hypothetical protein